MIGPKLQSTIQDIIMLCSLRPFVFLCDILQTFHQIKLRHEDQNIFAFYGEKIAKNHFILINLQRLLLEQPVALTRRVVICSNFLQNTFVNGFGVGAPTLSEVKEPKRQLIELCVYGRF